MKLIATFLTLFFIVPLCAQTPLTLPDDSPYASVSQRIGLTDVTVAYYSPAVKGRQIWGNVVPYGQLWRAGANQNTTVGFSHAVTINNVQLPAGTYGLHMLPGEKEWTVIFSKNSTSWGSFFYNPEEDAVRVSVSPKEHSFTEWLTYNFTQKEVNGAILALQWEKLEIPIKIEVNTKEIVFNNIKNELRSTAGFSWQGYYDGASYCYNNNMETEQATKWITIADNANPGNYSVLRLKSQLLQRTGDNEGAETAMKQALASAGENDMNAYGYELMGSGKIKEALEVFKNNAKKYPSSWNVHDSFAEALAASGDKKGAIKEYEQALKNNPPKEQAARIEETLKGLKA